MPQKGVRDKADKTLFSLSLYVSLYFLLFFIELSFVLCHAFLPPFYLPLLSGFSVSL